MDDKNTIQTTMSGLINDVRGIVESGLKKAYQNVNAITVFTYWQVGKRIVEEEQRGEKRAEYGAQIINIILVEAKSLHVVDHLVKAGTDRVAAAVRIGTVEGIKHDGLIRRIFEIALHHGQFIQVGHHGQVAVSHEISPFTAV